MAEPRAIGVDVGGTKILAGVVERDGTVSRRNERPTPRESEAAFLAALEEAVADVWDGAAAAIGIGVPSLVDEESGLVVGSVNIPLAGVDLGGRLSERFGVPAAITNDASAAALGEFRIGAGRGTRTMAMLTLGTGVGGGIVLGGRLYRGWAELGHIVVELDGRPCQGWCTGRGHLESYASGSAADRVAREEIGPEASARDLIESRHPALRSIGRYLGAGIASLVNIFHPEAVVVGGGFGLAAFDLLLAPACEVVEREVLPPGRGVRIIRAELGGDAGLVGAGFLAFEALE